MTDSAKKDLVDPLAALVKERRLCAQLLSKPYERGTYEAGLPKFNNSQRWEKDNEIPSAS
jgi:hypothetical protein